MSVVSPQPEDTLVSFGLKEFRPGQRDVIETVFAGRDCLCVMPTGGGKSLCFQLPAVARSGVVLVVSPLIALMQDQVDQLSALGLRATFVNSAIDSGEQAARLEQMADGAYDLVYVAAERFRSPRFLDAVARTELQLLAIDEAHCISEWGHDFRPDYARLGQHREKLGNPPTIALTATATAEVRRDIVAQLNLNDPQIFVAGFARPNLHMAVQNQRSRRGKDKALLDFIENVEPPGIIYSATRKTCEETAELIANATRYHTVHYHGGMETADRTDAQNEFMSGKADIVVATTAFGMGIDKANVRFVLHYHLPGSLEAYYQEAGRAGRDGADAHCLLLYAPRDAEIQEFFIESAYPAPEVVAQVWNFLRQQKVDPVELTQQEIKSRLNLSLGNEGVRACEHLLERAGALERLESHQNMAIVRIDSALPSMVEYLPKQATVRRRVLQMMEKVVDGQRGEMVSFSPRHVADALGLDSVALSRHLRELSELDQFEYVPPFRGRAIRLIRPELSFSQLELDFKTLEKRKRQEYAKLARVQSYAQVAGCRQLDILEYFGQENPQPCQECDNCRQSPAGNRAAAKKPGKRKEDDALTLVAARIALSGVARIKGRFGRNVIAQMLCGSTAAKMTKFHLNRLSTYGRLSFLRQEQVADLIDELITHGLITQVDADKYRPVVKLSSAGSAVMRGDANLPSQFTVDAELLQALRHNRGQLPAMESSTAESGPKTPSTEQATNQQVTKQEEAKPPAAAESDQELAPSIDHLLTGSPRLPQDDVAQSDEHELSAYEHSTEETNGDASTSAPRKSTLAADDAAAPARGAAKPSAAEKDSHYWTWRLFKAGFTPFEAAQIRNLDVDVIRDHALRSAQAGLAVDLKWFLSEEKIAAMESVIGEDPPKRVRPLLAKLPRGTRYEDVQLFLACREFGNGGAPKDPVN